MLAWMMSLLVCAVLPTASKATLIWDSNVGSPLSLAAFSPSPNDGLQTVNLANGYSIPFEGGVYSSISVATSGFIWLNSSQTNGSQCCVLSNETTTLADFANNPARIAPGWAALLPGLGGAIDFNEITDALGPRSVLTFSQVPTDPNNLAATVTFQLQLYTTGVIVFSYQQFGSASLGSNPATLIGLTEGFNSPQSPQSVDLANLPILAASGSIYDYLPTGGTGFDFSGRSIVFVPAPNNGFNIQSTLPTPEPATLIPAALTILLLALFRPRKNALPSTNL